MPLKVLIAPDKFKGTLTAAAAAAAIARGWHKARPDDTLDLLPMSDGGDGFGEVISTLLRARPQRAKTVDAAHRPCTATWWWEERTRTAIIESAKVVGLAMLPPKRFHPFDLDTFGLGAVLHAARGKGARQTIVGIGGSATNDGGFGLARAMGWEFFDRRGRPIHKWTSLHRLAEIWPPQPGTRTAESARLSSGEGVSRGRRLVDRAGMAVRAPDAFFGGVSGRIIVAVDVQNELLGAQGATRVYGPQKGLKPSEFAEAERNLRRLAQVVDSGGFGGPYRLLRTGPDRLKPGLQTVPGSGAAGGLGFGLLAFLGAELEPGFGLFARHAKLEDRLRKADLIITGEGAIDRSTLMGKGVGQIARLACALKIQCVGLAGMVSPECRRNTWFTQTRAMTELAALDQATAKPAFWLARLAGRMAEQWQVES